MLEYMGIELLPSNGIYYNTYILHWENLIKAKKNNSENVDDYMGFTDEFRNLVSVLENLGRPADVVYIQDLFVPRRLRGKGLGKAMVLETIKENPDKVITVCAAIHEDDISYNEQREMTVPQLDYALNNVGGFYQHIGFLNVNDALGRFKHMQTHLFQNEIGLHVIEFLKMDSKNRIGINKDYSYSITDY